MQKPVNRRSGVGVSVLPRKANGFEGVIPFEVCVNAGRLPVSLLMQMGYLSLEDDAASAPLGLGVEQHEVTLIAEIDHALRSPVDLRKGLREFVERSMAPSLPLKVPFVPSNSAAWCSSMSSSRPSRYTSMSRRLIAS
jgi:hypothetical protein